MKKILFTATIQLMCIALFAQNTKTTQAKVTKATVFLTGAQVTCTSAFQAASGSNEFIFEGVSPLLDLNSLQASAQGNVVIMDVKFETRYKQEVKKESPKQYERAIKAATDSITMLDFDIEETTNQLEAFNTEKNILLNNRLIKGDTHKDTLALFKESIEFLRQRLNNINTESMKLKKQLFFKNEAKVKLQERINTLSSIDKSGEAPEQEAVNTIVVTANADEAGSANISISFFVNQAAWLPVYDLRANSNGNIDLNYKAELRQTTGMNWNNVALTLSTGNPTQSTQSPELTPFYLNFYQAYKKKMEVDKMAKPATAEADSKSDDNSLTFSGSTSLTDYITVTEGMIQTEYDIKLKYTIPTDDNMHTVAIQNKTLKANYKYAVVPKLDMNAYLMAEITDWSEMSLIPGSARIYFDGSYIGRTVLNPVADADTMQLSLGKDRSILVSRKKLKDKTRERFIVDDKVTLTTYEIVVRNQKAIPISIEVFDQVPLSNNQSIKVNTISIGRAQHDEETGKLTWKLNLKPKESEKIQFSYEVTIPRDKVVAGL